MTDLRVLSAALDVYAEPGAGQVPIARLPVGTAVACLDGPDPLGWAKLKRVADGLVGWAYVYALGPAPLPASSQRRYEVSAAGLELRAGPGTDYRIIATMQKGSLVIEQIAPSGGWAEVQREDTGQVGWAYAQYLLPAPARQSPVPGAPAGPAPVQPTQPATAPAAPLAPSPSPASPPTQAGLCWRASQQVQESGGSAIVFDVSHFQGDVDAQAAYADGLRGMLHKATEGTGFVDPLYARNRAAAKAAGMLWGAYHFGVGGNAAGQAQFFLEHAQPDGRTLLVLDFESNPQGASMTLAEARELVSYLHEKTGKWPGLYGGSYARELLGNSRDPVLGNCWFWLADYTERVASVPPTWDYWTLWQYTDGNAGPEPHTVAGVPGGRCDRDRFVGNASELVAFWTACGV